MIQHDNLNRYESSQCHNPECLLGLAKLLGRAAARQFLDGYRADVQRLAKEEPQIECPKEGPQIITKQKEP